MTLIIKILAIGLMAFFSFTAYPVNITTYDLVIDFGNDWSFVQYSTMSEKRCKEKLKEVQEDLKDQKVKLVCIKRG